MGRLTEAELWEGVPGYWTQAIGLTAGGCRTAQTPSLELASQKGRLQAWQQSQGSAEWVMSPRRAVCGTRALSSGLNLFYCSSRGAHKGLVTSGR